MESSFIVVMGVSGTGKSTLATALARALNIPFVEGDSLHPPSNIEKMSNGIPLTDEDRLPWLELVRATAEKGCHLQDSEEQGKKGPKFRGVVITCSALKRRYRDVLRRGGAPTKCRFVFIKGDRDLILGRMQKRKGHYMRPSMLDSQFDDLESPEGEDGVVVVDAEDATERQVERVVAAIP